MFLYSCHHVSKVTIYSFMLHKVLLIHSLIAALELELFKCWQVVEFLSQSFPYLLP